MCGPPVRGQVIPAVLALSDGSLQHFVRMEGAGCVCWRGFLWVRRPPCPGLCQSASVPKSGKEAVFSLVVKTLHKEFFLRCSLHGCKSSTQNSALHPPHPHIQSPKRGTRCFLSLLPSLTLFPASGISFWLASPDLCGACF